MRPQSPFANSELIRRGGVCVRGVVHGSSEALLQIPWKNHRILSCSFSYGFDESRATDKWPT